MTEYFYPERMARIILLAMEEVIGREGVHSVLHLSCLASYADEYPAARSDKTFSFKAVTQLQESLEQFYGPQGGRGQLCELDVPASNMVCANMVPCWA